MEEIWLTSSGKRVGNFICQNDLHLERPFLFCFFLKSPAFKLDYAAQEEEVNIGPIYFYE